MMLDAGTTSALVLAIGTALAIAIPVPGITEVYVQRARDAALMGLLACAVGVLVYVGEAWLACIAASLTIHWRSHRELPSVVCWVGIAGAWLLATRLAAMAR